MIIIFIFELLILAYLAADDVEQYRDKDRVRHGGGMWVAILLLLIGNAFWTYVMEIPIGEAIFATVQFPALRWLLHDLYFNINALGWKRWAFIGTTASIDKALRSVGLIGWKQFIPKLAAFPVCWGISYLINLILSNWL